MMRTWLDRLAGPTGQDRWRGLRWWWQHHLGLPGLAAVLLLAVALVLAVAVRPGLGKALAEQQALLATRQAAQAQRAAALPSTGQAEPHEAWLAALPTERQRGETITKLLHLLDKAGVAVSSADYVAEDAEPGLVRVRITLPFKGGYAATRKLLASVLNNLPSAALDGMSLDRSSAGAASAPATDGLNGQLRLSLFFRKAAP